MAIFSMQMKALPRKVEPIEGKEGYRSAAAAAAYVLATNITNPLDGQRHDYSHKKGVFDTFTIGPDGHHFDPEILWPAVELHHKRGDAVPARLIILALPEELTQAQNLEFAKEFIADFTKMYGIAASVGMHLPEQNGDQRNVHMHVIYTSCSVAPGAELMLGRKVAALDSIAAKRAKIENVADIWRKKWELAVNAALKKAGSDARIDCRTLVDQRVEALENGNIKLAAELDREPTRHLGPKATGYERRTGKQSQRRKEFESAGAATKSLIAIIKKSIETVTQEIAAMRRQLIATLREVLLLKQSEAPAHEAIDSAAASAREKTKSTDIDFVLQAGAQDDTTSRNPAQQGDEKAQAKAQSKAQKIEAPARMRGQKSKRGVRQPERTKVAVVTAIAKADLNGTGALVTNEDQRIRGGTLKRAQPKFEDVKTEVASSATVAAASTKLDEETTRLLEKLQRRAVAGSTVKGLNDGDMLEHATRLGLTTGVEIALAFGAPVRVNTINFAVHLSDPKILKMLKGGLQDFQIVDMLKPGVLSKDAAQALDAAIAVQPEKDAEFDLKMFDQIFAVSSRRQK